MRTKRIKAGFHRIGIVGAVICGIPAALLLGFAAVQYGSGKPGDAFELAAIGSAWAIGSGLFYAASRALGWIVSGFAGDADQISN